MFRVSIEVLTWQKESHGLYDYESRQIIRQVYKVKNQDTHLVRDNNQVIMLNEVDQTQVLQRSQPKPILVSLLQEQNQLTLKAPIKSENYHELPIEMEQPQKSKRGALIQSQQTMFGSDQQQMLRTHQQALNKKVWLVVSAMQNILPDGGVLLEKGDIIKLGRIKLRVREINVLKDSLIEIRSLPKSQSQICRVCLHEGDTLENPLLNPCKCNGTMKYIHLECLQTWLRQKLQSRHNNNCTIYLWKDLQCELCKFQYNPVFESDGFKYDLVELCQPKGVPFVLLELRSKRLQPHQIMDVGDPFTQKSCGIYIITFQDKNEVKLGRGHENEVKISDISVSRIHAQLHLKNDHQLILRDLKSKFGSLLLLKNDLSLSPELNDMQVQVGRTVMKFQISGACVKCLK